MKSLIIFILASVGSSLSFAQGLSEKAVNKAFNPPKADKKKKKKEEIPLLVNVGVSLSQYRLFDVYNTPSGAEEVTPQIFATELNLSAVVENQTIRRFKDKIPKNFRDLALKLREVSATHLYVPKTIYVHPKSTGNIEAYGITWGLTPSLGFGPDFFQLFVSGGPILTYLYFRDFNQSEGVNFINLGLRGTVGAKVPMLWNRVVLEVGGRGDLYIPQKFYGDEGLWNIRGVYAMFHFRFPITVEAEI